MAAIVIQQPELEFCIFWGIKNQGPSAWIATVIKPMVVDRWRHAQARCPGGHSGAVPNSYPNFVSPQMLLWPEKFASNI